MKVDGSPVIKKKKIIKVTSSAQTSNRGGPCYWANFLNQGQRALPIFFGIKIPCNNRESIAMKLVLRVEIKS